ncbi:Ecdysteroid UDP-glucosyltransferase [Eumeta japonica]|uniref:Ecdysteroid UDP-glucosyltransferase n=1 Tax=Eumeta variegata TaxID=151549 RepID=A0A4C1VWI1_EUMVA|nr:Ecdysteroid UDP-glucosyltransferase [Eumeta japonica]
MWSTNERKQDQGDDNSTQRPVKGLLEKRSKGRPLKRWADDIKELAGKDWLILSQNRDKWKELEEAFTRKGTLVHTNEAYKILVVLPVKVPSQNILCNGYVDNLLRAGHEVTYITPFPRKELPPKFRQIVFDYPDNLMPGNILTIEKILNKSIDVMDMSLIISPFLDGVVHCLRDKNVQNLINDPNESFDAVIIEWLMLHVISGFAAVFQAPLIWSNPAEASWLPLSVVDEVPNPAYAPDILADYFHPYTFWQRAKQLLKQISMPVILYYFNSKTEHHYEEVFVAAGKKKGIALPSMAEVNYNASFMFSNSHVSLGEPIRLPQNFIPIAGYHIDQKPKPLPEDLQKIMDNAKHGVIYFSMGSNIQSRFIPEKMKREFLDMFSKFKQTVLWKFEDVLPDLPSNVHIIKWAPQHSILGE